MIVQRALSMRGFLHYKGISAKTMQQQLAMSRLQRWVESYQYPSSDAIRRFRDGQLMSDLNTVMPHNRGGRSLLGRFDELTKHL